MTVEREEGRGGLSLQMREPHKSEKLTRIRGHDIHIHLPFDVEATSS
jgi:hypothetical protein